MNNHIPTTSSSTEHDLTSFSECLQEIRFNERGLVPVITYEQQTHEVLMLAWMNEEALCKTYQTRRATYWSRSRQTLWTKGETSGNWQEVQHIFLDCDGDTILLYVTQHGTGCCHTGQRNCFFRILEDKQWSNKPSFTTNHVLSKLDKVLAQRILNGESEKSYTAQLIKGGMEKMLSKIDEESNETIVAAREATQNGNNLAVIKETADLWFHCMVMLASLGESSSAVLDELNRRSDISGLVEKAARSNTSK